MKVSFKAFHIIRPLLKWSKKDILEYSKKYDLFWVNDSTNFTNLYLRNAIRNLYVNNHNFLFLPVGVLTTYVKQLNFFLNIVCETIFDSMCINIKDKYKIYISYVHKLPLFVKKEIIRIWFIKNNLAAPSYNTILNIYHTIILSKFFYSYLKLEFCFIIKYNKFMFIYKL
jgi:hypothetical protein